MNPDPFDLNRFVLAQQDQYEQALGEIRRGQKRTHWMWFIFPQIEGLGSSPTALRYAIRSLSEAQAYLEHELLGSRLLECADAVVSVEGRSASDMFGSPDDLKLRSSATLFAQVSPQGSVFERLLSKYYRSIADPATLALIANTSHS